MAKLEIESQPNGQQWTLFKHGNDVYRVTYYEMGTIEEFEKAKIDNYNGVQ